MAWERRRGGRRYYYRIRRVGNHIAREYCGAGERGRQAAAADQAARAARADAKRIRAEQRQPLDEVAADLDELKKVVDLLLACQLHCDGWKQHHRQWRRPKHV